MSAYARSEEHLDDELRRIDQLVRAQTLRWQAGIAATKSEQLWGMVHVTAAEVDAYLQATFSLCPPLPAEVESRLATCWQAAEAMAKRIDARRSLTPPGVTLRVDRLQKLFGLSDLERDVLLVCLLAELDGRYRRLFGYLQDDASRTKPNVELALQILRPPASRRGAARSIFNADAPLLAHRLLRTDRHAATDEPLPMRPIRVDDRIAGYLLGDDAPDGRLRCAISRIDERLNIEELAVHPDRIRQLKAMAEWLDERRQGPAAGVVLFLHGAYGSGRLAAARALCTATSSSLLRISIEDMLHLDVDWVEAVDLAYREAALQGAALYWAGCERLLDSSSPPHRFTHLIGSAETGQGVTFVASETAWDPVGRFHETPFLRVEFSTPNYELRRRLWEVHLPGSETFAAPSPDRVPLAELLANGFQLTEGQIVDAVIAARRQATLRDPTDVQLTIDDLHEGCRRQSSRMLLSMARRIEPRTELTFDDLILPEPNRRQLMELRDRIRHRSRVYSGLGFERRLTLGKGLIALFTGSSGTGKTMAAELLAREQGVDLYKVDLSAVVSKYVGETEKNLSKVFSEAEDANAIVFFDEADALFGRRGEVREARDRWANMEINYLLQRVEEYAGVVVLASNLRQNIDEAFQRRIHTVVEFPFPDAAARLRILIGLFPDGIVRPSDEDLGDLADRFKLSGGSFKNIVVDAAFRALATAAGDGPRITLRHLAAATAREYQKLGKPITKGEFGPSLHGWVAEDIFLRGDETP